jgi:hypothetical protein
LEVRIETEVSADLAAAHDGEADAVHEAEPPSVGGEQRLESGGVIGIACPDGVNHGEHLADQCADRVRAQTRLSQSDRSAETARG